LAFTSTFTFTFTFTCYLLGFALLFGVRLAAFGRGRSSMLTLLTALAVTAAPYPEPLLIRDEPMLKYATGTVQSVDPSGTRLVLATSAGPLFLFAGQAAVLDEDHRDRQLRSVVVGRTVHVWYVVHDGAVAREIDLVTPADVTLAPPSDNALKTAMGRVHSLGATMILLTQAGPVTFQVGRAPKPKGLKTGDYVKVTYVVNDGARVRKIELAPAPSEEPVG
jgi:hypothetical protein